MKSRSFVLQACAVGVVTAALLLTACGGLGSERVFLPVLSAVPALPLFRQCFGQQRQFQQHARELQLGKQF